MVVLCLNAEAWLRVETLLKRPQRQIERTESCTGCSQAVMNVCCFRFALQSSFEHLLRRDILASIKFHHTAVIKRIGIAWKNAVSAQARLRDREIRARASCDFRYLRVLVQENSKLIPRFSKPASYKFLVSTLKSKQCCRLIHGRWTRRWRRSRCGSDGTNRSLLLRRFDP